MSFSRESDVVKFTLHLSSSDVFWWQKLKAEWCKRAMLLPTQLWRFRAAFREPKVTFQYLCSEAIMNYFTFYYMLSESKHIFFMSQWAQTEEKQQREAGAHAGLAGQQHSQRDATWQKQKPSRFCTMDCSGFRLQHRVSTASCDGKRLGNVIRFNRNANRVSNALNPTNDVHIQIFGMIHYLNVHCHSFSIGYSINVHTWQRHYKLPFHWTVWPPRPLPQHKWHWMLPLCNLCNLCANIFI